MTSADSWQPGASLEILRLRAGLLAAIRGFFAARGVLEVETPILSAAGTPDPNLHSFSTRYVGPGAAHGRTHYLHTSPEFPMKRLLAAGSGPIYQLCKVFRQGELGRRHNPEFTMLEWYRPGFDHHVLMGEVAELLTALLSPHRSLAAPEHLSYAGALERYAGVDPSSASGAQLRACAAQHGIHAPPGLGDDERDGWLDLLMTHTVEPHLGRGRLTFVHGYPPSQAALARILPGPPPVAARFECYLEGVELANGFHELADSAEQARRFAHDAARRSALGLESVPADTRLLAALAHGLPDCAGVAVGVDRLVMLAAGVQDIARVLAFPFESA